MHIEQYLCIDRISRPCCRPAVDSTSLTNRKLKQLTLTGQVVSGTEVFRTSEGEILGRPGSYALLAAKVSQQQDCGSETPCSVDMHCACPCSTPVCHSLHACRLPFLQPPSSLPVSTCISCHRTSTLCPLSVTLTCKCYEMHTSMYHSTLNVFRPSQRPLRCRATPLVQTPSSSTCTQEALCQALAQSAPTAARTS